MKTALETQPEKTDDNPDETHVVCCDDHEHSLCGTIVEWTTPVEDGREPTCVVCYDLSEAYYCPFTGVCRHK